MGPGFVGRLLTRTPRSAPFARSHQPTNCFNLRTTRGKRLRLQVLVLKGTCRVERPECLVDLTLSVLTLFWRKVPLRHLNAGVAQPMLHRADVHAAP
jgi:hypothetical protein